MTDLNKYFKRHLQGRSILNESSIELNLFEKRMIKHILTAKFLGYTISVITPISDRISLDFIGWDNPEYNDVLIIKFNKHQLLNL